MCSHFSWLSNFRRSTKQWEKANQQRNNKMGQVWKGREDRYEKLLQAFQVPYPSAFLGLCSFLPMKILLNSSLLWVICIACSIDLALYKWNFNYTSIFFLFGLLLFLHFSFCFVSFYCCFNFDFWWRQWSVHACYSLNVATEVELLPLVLEARAFTRGAISKAPVFDSETGSC